MRGTPSSRNIEEPPLAKRWRDAPSPCIDICKYRDAGRCIGCGMTKPEKKSFKRLGGKAEKKAFFRELVARLGARYDRWAHVYRRKCDKKDVPCPLDRLEARADA